MYLVTYSVRLFPAMGWNCRVSCSPEGRHRGETVYEGEEFDLEKVKWHIKDIYQNWKESQGGYFINPLSSFPKATMWDAEVTIEGVTKL